jgi:uncharacterized protein involved in exopolysaccharide biosynthesis
MSEQSFNTISEDEISLKDIINFLAESWKVIIFGSVVGGLLGLGYSLIAPAKYQATANIQVAKVAGADVEAPAILVEKLKMPMYYSQKVYVACNVIDELEPGEVIAKKLKPTLIKNAPIIAISYQESSPGDAQKCLESILDDVRANQGLLAKPILQSKANRLLNLKLKLESAEKIVKIMPNKNTSFDFSASTVLLAITLSKENQIQDLRTEINDLEMALLEPQTKEAFLITPIYASQQKLSPKRTIIIMVGVMAGLLIGLLLLMVKRAYGAYMASNQQ